jgi:hypothetical protein
MIRKVTLKVPDGYRLSGCEMLDAEHEAVQRHAKGAKYTIVASRLDHDNLCRWIDVEYDWHPAKGRRMKPYPGPRNRRCCCG